MPLLATEGDAERGFEVNRPECVFEGPWMMLPGSSNRQACAPTLTNASNAPSLSHLREH